MEKLLNVGYAVMDNIDGKEYFGGAAAWIAINGKRLGITTGLCALFGIDTTSMRYWDFLVKEGIDLSLSLQDKEVKIPENFISHTNRNIGWRDYNISSHFEKIDIQPAAINGYQVVHLASPHYTVTKRANSHLVGGIWRYIII